LPSEIAAEKKQDGLSLRMMPLSTVLSYSQDDCNERIFEASVAAELFRSCVAMNFANIIVDMLVAASNLSSMADLRFACYFVESFSCANFTIFRIVSAVKRLQDLNVDTRAKLTPAVKPAAQETAPPTSTTTAPENAATENNVASTAVKTEAIVASEDKSPDANNSDGNYTVEQVQENNAIFLENGGEEYNPETAADQQQNGDEQPQDQDGENRDNVNNGEEGGETNNSFNESKEVSLI
jgi:hypothetical protein